MKVCPRERGGSLYLSQVTAQVVLILSAANSVRNQSSRITYCIVRSCASGKNNIRRIYSDHGCDPETWYRRGQALLTVLWRRNLIVHGEEESGDCNWEAEPGRTLLCILSALCAAAIESASGLTANVYLHLMSYIAFSPQVLCSVMLPAATDCTCLNLSD